MSAPSRHNYEVTIRDKINGNKWAIEMVTDSFAKAEEEALNVMEVMGDKRISIDYQEIIRIEKDYNGL